MQPFHLLGGRMEGLRRQMCEDLDALHHASRTWTARLIQEVQSAVVYSHVDVWRLEASLVDVVEGEGLCGVGAVLIHLHRRPGTALGTGLGLRLLTSCRHDFWQSEGHGGREELLQAWQQLVETVPVWGRRPDGLKLWLSSQSHQVEARTSPPLSSSSAALHLRGTTARSSLGSPTLKQTFQN